MARTILRLGTALILLGTFMPQLLIPDYTLPGLFLLVIMGLTPLGLIHGLWRGNRAPHVYGYPWVWIGTLALCAMLAVWLLAQAALTGFQRPIQYITASTES